MPSQITHSLFGSAVMEALHLSIKYAAWFNLGCQGPDIFLHNQRTKPSSLTWGRQMHRNGYGTYLAFLTASLKEMGKELDSPEGSYLLGFITHAILDRISHPYIVYHAGWGRDHRFFHPLLERLIDSAIAEYLGKERPGSVSFFKTIDLGENPPESFIQLHTGPISSFIRKKYSEEEIHRRLRNAYDDTMHFLRKTDLWDDKLIRNVINLEDPVRRAYLISVFHHPRIPRYLDVLNRERRIWHHPWAKEISSNETYPELFSQGVEKSSEVIQSVLVEWNQWNDHSPSVIASVIGNESLDTGLPYDPHLPPVRKAPLPLGRFFSEFF